MAHRYSIGFQRITGRLTDLACLGMLIGLGIWGFPDMGWAQPAAPVEGNVQLTFPMEIDLRGLIDYVSERVGVRILYDEKIATRKITIRAPGEIPVDSLLSLLQSTLRMSGLALVDADTPGWKKIVDAGKFPEVAQPHLPGKEPPPPGATVVTQAFPLKHIDLTQMENFVKPFLTQPGANTLTLKDQRLLIVTDYASNMAKISQLIELVDRPRSSVVTQLVPVQHQSAETLAEQINTILTARLKAEGLSPQNNDLPTVLSDPRTNQLILIGNQERVTELLAQIQTFDIPLQLTTEVYSFTGISAERLDKLLRGVLPPEKSLSEYRSTIDSESNLLIVGATQDVHRQLKELAKQLDQPQHALRTQRIRFYKLKHARAQELLETLRSIEQGDRGRQPQTGLPDQNHPGRLRLMNDARLPGPNQANLPPQQPVQNAPLPPALQPPPEGPPPILAAAGLDLEQVQFQLGQGRARVSADTSSNSIIVMADPVLQAAYAELIQVLDQPRPQVLIEAKVVVLDTSDDFSLGVEISGGDRIGTRRLFSFSSFGLSTVSPVNGALSIIPGTGFNGTLVDPEVADVVIRAFTRHRRAKVVSAPRVLVNDNATGLLTSVTEIPFTSVNASQTVATTSFAGFAQAGTTIRVTPHISSNDQLQLEYQITLNDFQGTAAGGVPPPRVTDELESEVTVPDGHTLIVGGLNRTSTSDTTDGLPFVEGIPLLRSLLSNNTSRQQQMSLFIFLRPVILRDDKFHDLRYYSTRDLKRAGERPDFPVSRPVLVR